MIFHTQAVGHLKSQHHCCVTLQVCDLKMHEPLSLISHVV